MKKKQISINKYNEKQIEKNQQALKRAKFITIEMPPRFINPFIFYAIYPHVLLAEENRKIRMSFQAANYYSRVYSVEINSPFPGFVSVKHVPVFLNDHCKFDRDYFLERLKSFGDNEHYEWAQMLENYPQIYGSAFTKTSNIIQNNYPKCSVTDCMVSPNEQEKFFQKKATHILTMRYDENMVTFLDIAFSMEYLEMLGYTVEEFINLCFKSGVPCIDRCDEEELDNNYTRFGFKIIFELQFIPGAPPVKRKILASKNKLINVEEKFGIFVNKMENDSLLVRMYNVYKKLGGKGSNKDCIPKLKIENPLRLKEKEHDRDLLNEFLEKYYPNKLHKTELEKVIEELKLSKTCKIKNISEP